MKLVHISDLHLDTAFAWAGPELSRRRRRLLRQALANAVDLAKQVDATALLCAGDMYEHERVSTETARFLRQELERLHPIRAFLAPGNHDWFAPESVYARTDWSDNVHVFRRAQLEPMSLSDSVTLWGAAHCAPAGTRSFLEGFRAEGPGRHLALFHGSERRGLSFQGEDKVEHAPFEDHEVAEAGLSHAFVGHYHRPHDGPNHTYPGNPVPLTFGEAGERGAVVVSVQPDGTLERERVKLIDSELAQVELDVTGCRGISEVRERAESLLRDRTGVARLVLSGEIDSDVAIDAGDLEDVALWMDAVVPNLAGVRSAYDFTTIAGELTVRGQFVRDVRAAQLSDEEKRRVLITGLRALEGRGDLEVPH